MSDTHQARFECCDPILRVEDMAAAVRYYVEVLGFEPANYPWALEIHVEDLDGNVLRMGSDSKKDRP